MNDRSDLPKIISVDDHIVEPPMLWQNRLPAKYREVGPRVARYQMGYEDVHIGTGVGGFAFTYDDDDGIPGDVWLYEDMRIPQMRINAAVGFDRADMGLVPVTYDEMRPGCYEQGARLADMDQNLVESSLSFPNMFVRFCGQVFLEAKDRDLALLCVKAYNDWMLEEWSAGSDGRLIPLCIIPLWDVELAAQEVRRNAARGCHAVCFSELPSYLGLPSIHSGQWDPFFEACEQTETVINIHIGSGSRLASTSDDAPGGVVNTLTFLNSCMSLTDWLLSGVFLRFPNLRVAFAESQIGWLPYLLERIDQGWVTAQSWNGIYGTIPEPPSSYFHTNVWVCFFDDSHGVHSLDVIGSDRVLIETDYPHADSTWPNSIEIVSGLQKHLDEATVQQIVRGNAIALLNLDEDGRCRI